ncbi:MAG: hypothetical protein ABIH01_04985 [Candidatus Omnitrophota bacterium]
MNRVATATKGASAYTRKRIYWKTSGGLEHGFITKENGTSVEAYSYASGETVQVAKKDITKVIAEEL